MDIDRLLQFVSKQQGLSRKGHTCYEAGAFGYYLHHRLEAMEVSNLVGQPQGRDERGNRKTFSVVREICLADKSARRMAEKQFQGLDQRLTGVEEEARVVKDI